MSDLISKEDIKELMRKYGFKAPDMTIHEFVEDCLPSIESKQKWIPVTEALPINDVEVIVSILDDFGDTPYRFTSVGWCTPDGRYWVVNNEICYGVIAWMPLPEPYRGE